MSLEERRQRRELTAAFSNPTRGCQEDGARLSEAGKGSRWHMGNSSLKQGERFFIMREVKYWKEGSERCTDLHPRRQSKPLPRHWHAFQSSSCPSPTELPLFKLLYAQPAPCSMDHRCPAVGVPAQRTGLCRRTAGLKAKKEPLTPGAQRSSSCL